jgi:hypothetical protein
MPINYTVQADVIDISTDTPLLNDQFLVDTNVWYWMVYTRATIGPNPPRPGQLNDYPNYLKQSLAVGSSIRYCNLTLAEIAHIIEKTEREIYGATSGFNARNTKEFRHNFPVERANVASEVQSAWTQISSLGTSMEATVNDAMSSAAVLRFQTEALDGYDLFVLEAMTDSRTTQVITDDGDYCGVPGIQMFTSNRAVVNAAQAQGKLVVR